MLSVLSVVFIYSSGDVRVLDGNGGGKVYSTCQLIMHKPRLARTLIFTPIYKRINCARTISLNLMKITSFKLSKLLLLINKISSDFYRPIILIFGMPPLYYNNSLNSLPYT